MKIRQDIANAFGVTVNAIYLVGET